MVIPVKKMKVIFDHLLMFLNHNDFVLQAKRELNEFRGGLNVV